MEVALKPIIGYSITYIIALLSYLMLGSRTHTESLADLPGCALAELDGLLAAVQKAIES
ncbi:hypothetical protein [Pseudomonas sp. PS01303]|jgi:hypothetical protein|uniref:hypothetical protein n=1 Tax=Pseudomonas sp. PS01303 TaxID=2991439 RepID=UPI00249A1BC8|nr:hypothetical protein [Pseudomonas sp. PS01303]